MNAGRAAGIAPEPEERRVTSGDLARDLSPSVRRHDDARPGAVAFHALSFRHDVGERGHRLTQQSGDVLEPGNERRRHVDSSSEDEGEMREHRYIGGARFGTRTARLAESDAVEPQEQSGKP